MTFVEKVDGVPLKSVWDAISIIILRFISHHTENEILLEFILPEDTQIES